MGGNNTVVERVHSVQRRFTNAGLHFGHGTDNAGDEAAWLVLHVIGAPLDGRFENWGDPVDENDGREIDRIAAERCASGKPLAYLLGTARFAGLEFVVNEDVLVPRSPIAELILDGFAPWVNAGDVERALDLCTGSGCIGITMAMHMPEARVDLADISPKALAVAERNVRKHGLGDRVRIVQSDLLEALHNERYQLVVANPPYVPRDGLRSLPSEYRAEPSLGLVSGEDGLDAPLRILLDAARVLCEDGVLICEVGESEYRLDKLLPGVPFTWLEFENGGSGVFLLTREQLMEAEPLVAAAREERKHVV